MKNADVWPSLSFSTAEETLPVRPAQTRRPKTERIIGVAWLLTTAGTAADLVDVMQGYQSIQHTYTQPHTQIARQRTMLAEHLHSHVFSECILVLSAQHGVCLYVCMVRFSLWHPEPHSSNKLK